MRRYATLAAVLIALGLGGCATVAEAFEPACPPVPEPAPHPVYSAEGLQLIMNDAYGLMEPIHLIADTSDTVIGATPMELELHGPNGAKWVQQFMHHNAIRFTPRCDPVAGPNGRGTGCENVRPQEMGTGGTRIELPRELIQGLGWYTAVLYRPGTGERLSKRFQIVVSTEPQVLALGWKPSCAELPEVVDGYRRVACEIARMPVAAVQGAWGDRARYRDGSCVASAYAVSLDNGMRLGFQTNGLGLPEVRRYPEGEVRAQRGKDGQVVAWLGDGLFVAVEPPGLGARADRFVRAVLRSRPPLPPRPREVPVCASVPSLGKHSRPFRPLAQIAKEDKVYFHYEGNTLAGADLSEITSTYFFDMAGFRPKDIIQSIDDEPVNTPECVRSVKERLGAPGRKRVLVWRRPYGKPAGYGCLELEIQPPP